MSDLFSSAGLEKDAPLPLAEKLRPKKLSEVVGQDHLTDSGGTLGKMLKAGRLSSLVFWGPPGTGKTTIARLLAEETSLHFEQISAVFSGVADLRKCFEAAKMRRKSGKGTLLFVDEIHRFNRSQQDGFLPYVENGTIILVGATTENPSFELNAALLSRMQVMVLNRLDEGAMEELLRRAEESEGKKIPATAEARALLSGMADGDGRYLLGLAEILLSLEFDEELDSNAVMQVLQKRAPQYDKSGEGHYNLISALHKSLRGSDTDAALYWMARMIEGGEDPMYLIRRLIRFAVEDIGLADPNALIQAIATKDAYQFLGSPEGDLALSQLVIYLGTAPKSNAAYMAFKSAVRHAKTTGSLSPPMHILNAPTKMMKDLGYGKNYQYDHDSDNGFSGQNFFPDGMDRVDLYQPKERGFERDVKKRLDYWSKLRKR
jgi:putative ATPase